MSLLFENYVIRVNLGQKLGLKKKSRRHGLLTKCEVKMAGYWPSFFFACLRTGSQSRRAIWFILPVRGAGHMININYCNENAKRYILTIP